MTPCIHTPAGPEMNTGTDNTSSVKEATSCLGNFVGSDELGTISHPDVHGIQQLYTMPRGAVILSVRLDLFSRSGQTPEDTLTSPGGTSHMELIDDLYCSVHIKCVSTTSF